MTTIFSRIIAGELPGRFVWADDDCAVFASIAPLADGHLLVVPRIEVARFTDADPNLFAHLAAVAQIVGRACELAFPGTRATLLIAGFEVPHLHLHVVSVQRESQLNFANARSDASAGELDHAVEKVRSALIQMGHGAQVTARPDATTLV